MAKDQTNNPERFTLENPSFLPDSKVSCSFFRSDDNRRSLRLVCEDTIGGWDRIWLTPEQLREICGLAQGRLVNVPEIAPDCLVDAVSDQVLAQIRDNEKNLLEFASGKTEFTERLYSSQLIRACVLVALRVIRSQEI